MKYALLACLALTGCTIDIKPQVNGTKVSVDLCLEEIEGQIVTIECEAGSTLQPSNPADSGN